METDIYRKIVIDTIRFDPVNQYCRTTQLDENGRDEIRRQMTRWQIQQLLKKKVLKNQENQDMKYYI